MKFVNFLIAGVFAFSFSPLPPALGQGQIVSAQQAQMALTQQLGGSPNIPGTMYAQSGCQRSPSPSLTPIVEALDTTKDEVKELEDERKIIEENIKKCEKNEPKRTKANGERVPWCEKDNSDDSSSSTASTRKEKSDQEKIRDLFHPRIIEILETRASGGRLKLEQIRDCSSGISWWKSSFDSKNISSRGGVLCENRKSTTSLRNRFASLSSSHRSNRIEEDSLCSETTIKQNEFCNSLSEKGKICHEITFYNNETLTDFVNQDDMSSNKFQDLIDTCKNLFDNGIKWPSDTDSSEEKETATAKTDCQCLKDKKARIVKRISRAEREKRKIRTALRKKGENQYYQQLDNDALTEGGIKQCTHCGTSKISITDRIFGALPGLMGAASAFLLGREAVRANTRLGWPSNPYAAVGMGFLMLCTPFMEPLEVDWPVVGDVLLVHSGEACTGVSTLLVVMDPL